jgi:cytidine deaminase
MKVCRTSKFSFHPVAELYSADIPLHMRYPVWDMGDQGPQAVADYLTWILSDDQRMDSAIRHLGFLQIGMHFLTAGQRFDNTGQVVDKLELNFWSEEYPPDEAQGSGGHAHSRSPKLWSFIDPDARQHVTGVMLLPPGAHSVPGLETREGLLTMLNKVDDGRGLGTRYHPVVIGNRRFTEYTVDLPPLSSQRFQSTFVHDVRYSAPNNSVGVSVQRQGPPEHESLNSLEGLVTYKGLTREEAERDLSEISAIVDDIRVGSARFVGSTVLIRSLDFDPAEMQESALRTPDDRLEKLIIGALRSLRRIGAHPQAPSAHISAGKWGEKSSEKQVGVIVRFENLPADVQGDLLLARELTENELLNGKSTKVGCVITEADQGQQDKRRFVGINIKRDYGVGATHAEDVAVGQVLAAGARLGYVSLYGEIDGIGRVAIPDGNCREILLHALRTNGQEDVVIYAMGDPDQGVVKVWLSELLPLADGLLKSETLAED